MTAPDATRDPLTPQVREQLSRSGTPNIANALLGLGFRNVLMSGVQALDPGQPQLLGPAYTLRFIPAREDMDELAGYREETNVHRRAIEESPEGSVLVIDANGSRAGSSMGDMMATRLAYRGVKGVVTDGGFRDAQGIRATGLSCFHAGPAPAATPIALHPLALNEPVGCGGVAVYPGDVLVGDADGVVVIPRHHVSEVARIAADAADYESWAAEKLRVGAPLHGTFPASEHSRAEFKHWASEKHGAQHSTVSTTTNQETP